MPTTFETEETEDVQIVGIVMDDRPICDAGITASGVVYLRGDIHPLGSEKALALAAVLHVPHIAVNAVSVLFPADWLRGECMADPDRIRIIDNQEALVRRTA